MSAQKRRFLERNSAAPTFIGAGSVIDGNIRGPGQFVVSGEVYGDGEIEGDLILAANAVWHGHISAHQAIVAGEIIGSLTVQGKLEIGFSAVIRGSVSAQTVAIANGAIVDGAIEVTSGEPVRQFDEHREKPELL